MTKLYKVTFNRYSNYSRDAVWNEKASSYLDTSEPVIIREEQIPFMTGIIFENDIDFQVACKLSDHVVSAPPFEPVTEDIYNTAAKLLLKCSRVIDAGGNNGTFNRYNRKLLELAKSNGKYIER